jgi:hypothetical protein
MELMGHVSEEYASMFTQTDKMRFSFASRHQDLPTSSDHLTALKISRSTAQMDRVLEFYSSDIGVDALTTKKYDDGSELHVMMYDKPQKGIQLHFWTNTKAAKPRADINDDEFTVKMWEDYMHSVHKTYMISDVCGFDQWVDNHYAYDGDAQGGRPTMIDKFAEKAKSMGLQYHWWALPAPPNGGMGGQGPQGMGGNGQHRGPPGMFNDHSQMENHSWGGHLREFGRGYEHMLPSWMHPQR